MSPRLDPPGPLALLAIAVAVLLCLPFLLPAPLAHESFRAAPAAKSLQIVETQLMPSALIPSRAELAGVFSLDPCSGVASIVTGPACFLAQHSGSIGSFLSNPVGSLVSDAGNAALQALTAFFVQGCVWFLGKVADLVTSSTSVTPGAGWFNNHYLVMTQIAGWLALIVLLVNAAGVVVHRDPARLGRAVGMVGAAAFGTFTAVTVVTLLLTVSDSLSRTVTGSSGDQLRSALLTAANGLGHLDSSVPMLAVLIAAVIGVIGALMIWVELLVRGIGIYAALLFFPLALTGLAVSASNRWASRLAHTLLALIFSKFVILALLSLGAAAVNSGGSGYQGVLSGVGLLFLAGFAPWLLLRLIGAAELAVTIGAGAQVRAAASQQISSAGQLAMRTVALGGGMGGGGMSGSGMAAAGGGGQAGGGASHSVLNGSTASLGQSSGEGSAAGGSAGSPPGPVSSAARSGAGI
jgi:hypothetical protein